MWLWLRNCFQRQNKLLHCKEWLCYFPKKIMHWWIVYTKSRTIYNESKHGPWWFHVVFIYSMSTDLIRIRVDVKVLQKSSGKFTEQEVVCLINGPHTPVGVVIGTSACTKRPHWKQIITVNIFSLIARHIRTLGQDPLVSLFNKSGFFNVQGTPLLQLFALCIRSRCISFFACSL